MPAAVTVTVKNTVRLRLVCTPKIPALAAPIVARHLSIPLPDALHRLTRGPGPLADGLCEHAAARLADLLQTLGLRVVLEHQTSVAHREIDIALQATPDSDLPQLADRLAKVLGRSMAETLEDLHRPGGVILRAPDAGQIDRLRRAMRRLKGLRIATSTPEKAVFDLFPRTATQSRALMRHLALLGLTACPFNGALASGLDNRTVQHIALRFGDQVFGLERAFQRLDLYLTGSGTMSPIDLADFLATRHRGAGQIEALSPTVPLRVETGLSYAAARQFQTDYEMIGLHTVANLTRPG